MDYAQFLIDDQYLINYVIYRFKNKINGKVYIEQTTKSLRKRVTQHITNSRPNTKAHKTYFHNALNKHGIENFDLIILERCQNQQELDERERYWIAYYNSTDKRYGYNIESGGSLGKKGKQLSEEHKKALLQANLGKHRSEKTKRQLSKTHSEIWKDPEFRAKHITNILKVAGINRKSVYQYDLEGNFIKEWYSNHSVCEYLYGSKRKGNLRRDILSNNRKGKLGFTKKGSIWSYYSPNERRAY